LGSEAAPGRAISDALEREYNLRIRHPERDAVYRDFDARSAAYRARALCRSDLRYGDGPRCTLDWYAPSAPVALPPLLVFIHGGYWRALDKRTFGFIAPAYNAAGIAVALVGYDLAPEVTLSRIVDEAHAAHAWMARERTLAFDRSRVVVAGHSAGGHLAALIAAAEPERLGGLAVRAAVPVSGVFDLEPLLETSVNLDVRMGVEEARRLSPIRCEGFAARHLLVAVGALETDGFIGQSRRFVDCARALGVEAQFMLVPGRTHFDVLEDLADPAAALFRDTLKLCAPG
jgi:arylformamidase